MTAKHLKLQEIKENTEPSNFMNSNIPCKNSLHIY